MRPSTRIELQSKGALVVIDTPDGDVARTIIVESRKGARVATVALTEPESVLLAAVLTGEVQ